MRKELTAVIIAIMILFTFVAPTQAVEGKRPSKKGTAAKVGLGAAAGAGIGALIGGKRGAASGALIGGGAMAAQSMAKRDSGYGRNTRKIATIGAGTAVGAGVGAAVGGGKGAGIGALVGGGASAIYAFTRKDLKKPKEVASSGQSAQPGFSPSSAAFAPGQTNAVYSNDPYQQLSGPQGAGCGRLLCEGSSTMYQQQYQ